jgi:D-alanyl-lipoteichoic acid acyltransferase DltB (MBOAT superfamily)
LVSGPVQRYQDFERQMSGMASFRLSDEIWMVSLQRMAGGWFRVLVLGDATKHLWLGLKAMSLSETYPMAFGASQLMFLVHLYLDFSGYTSIVIGAGGLFGLKLPENFAHPFGARSFLDFWGRWHLTMSNWFKVYAFNPLLMLLTARWPSPRFSNAHGAAAFFVTFFLVGLWHGTTHTYVFCGLALGLCASCNQWYRSALRKRLGKKRFESLGDRLGYSMACKGAAFASLSMSVLPLWLSGAELGRVLPLYGGVGLMMSQAFVFLIMALTAVWSPPALFRAPMTLPGRCLLVAVQCLAIEMYLFLFPSFGGAFFYEQF